MTSTNYRGFKKSSYILDTYIKKHVLDFDGVKVLSVRFFAFFYLNKGIFQRSDKSFEQECMCKRTPSTNIERNRKYHITNHN